MRRLSLPATLTFTLAALTVGCAAEPQHDAFALRTYGDSIGYATVPDELVVCAR
jgi:hypothetical protein